MHYLPHCLSDIPDWYLNPPLAEDTWYGLGHARKDAVSRSRSKTLSFALADIARQVEVLANHAVIEIAREGGLDQAEHWLSVIESVSWERVQIALYGAKTEKTQVAQNGTVYAMASSARRPVLDALRNRLAAEIELLSSFNEWQRVQTLPRE